MPNFNPPWASSVKISYSLTEESFLEHCLSYNNGEFRDVTAVSQGQGFKPFIPLSESGPDALPGVQGAAFEGQFEPLLLDDR